MPYAMDNGMFHPPTGIPKPEQEACVAAIRHFEKCKGFHDPLFIVAPDVPYDGAASLARSRAWLPRLRQAFPALKVAIAVQDGMNDDAIDGFDSVFVAGSTEWKLKTGYRWCEMARDRGMWSHIARVNTQRRVQWAQDIGADSCDGSGIFRGDRSQLRGVLQSLVQMQINFGMVERTAPDGH